MITAKEAHKRTLEAIDDFEAKVKDVVRLALESSYFENWLDDNISSRCFSDSISLYDLLEIDEDDVTEDLFDDSVTELKKQLEEAGYHVQYEAQMGLHDLQELFISWNLAKPDEASEEMPGAGLNFTQGVCPQGVLPADECINAMLVCSEAMSTVRSELAGFPAEPLEGPVRFNKLPAHIQKGIEHLKPNSFGR